MFELDGQTALVTGAAKGVGKGIASVLARAGAAVVVGDIDEAAGRSTAEEISGRFLRLDVTRRGDCREAVQDVVRQSGRLDVLCSNTGIYPQARLQDMTEADWDRVHEVNAKGTFLVVQAALEAMRRRRYGRVVVTSSITGPITGYPGWSHYGASKAAQLGFIRSAALETAGDGITINAIMPGNVLTEGLADQGKDYLEEMRAAIPLHALAAPEDLGYAACFLASREAGYITGQTLVVDGGQVLPESPEAIAT